MEDTPELAVTLLLVYRSSLVRSTKPIYQPVQDLILGADCMDVLGEGEFEDETMMNNRGLFSVFRLYSASVVDPAPWSLPCLQTIIKTHIYGELVR
ncbi:hypothetical protein [Mycolicibacterium aichiense]|uniref:Uncharacterized protein n=1 Tax=Mycolicibacterium aichiense TaxID=1799 RepID=A0AAD1MEB3_9MYCO|nr:hypothetical protein [Mycolicibacterium aichiense]MCV7016752.1 hypothetical protein [Mycolicibacterium aichiense]BBX09465.1 hypothetical protein MAIC_42680 [Mycolicibacterium aichiense]SUA14030.1 Uncharacterised protein [Mycolicibacterium aichiense]